jgi:hypothetical protein
VYGPADVLLWTRMSSLEYQARHVL